MQKTTIPFFTIVTTCILFLSGCNFTTNNTQQIQQQNTTINTQYCKIDSNWQKNSFIKQSEKYGKTTYTTKDTLEEVLQFFSTKQEVILEKQMQTELRQLYEIRTSKDFTIIVSSKKNEETREIIFQCNTK